MTPLGVGGVNELEPVQIPLTRGQFALVDAADAARVSVLKWHAQWSQSGFYAIHIDGLPNGHRLRTSMHQLVIGAPAGVQVDHVNLDTLDNRRNNLRIASHGQNKANGRVYSNSRSGLKGVQARDGYWRARILADGHLLSLGRFASAEEAARAYDAKAREVHGAFARCNFD